MLEKQAEDFRKMRSGDMKAFERLFVSLYPGLCNIANHYLNNEMLSKDVAQDAFIKWWNKREDFRDFAAVKSFLYITIRNQCLNYIRDHRKLLKRFIRLSIVFRHNLPGLCVWL